MSKLNKNSIIGSLAILVILAGGAIMLAPKEANAQHAGRVNAYSNPKRINGDNDRDRFNEEYEEVMGTTNVSYVVYNYPTTNTTSAKNTSSTSTAKKSTTNSTEKKTILAPENSDETFSGLAANALFGGDSFMPSGLTQWLLFIILILAGVIFVRKTFGAERAYLTSPLKHD